jgi:hypothetical protein
MTTIRPNIGQAPAPQAAPKQDARAAFFQAIQGTAPTARPAAPAVTLPAPAPQPAPRAELPPQPARILRPGSIIDIKV